ncbi:hypothetical protein FALBO_16039 [Fusarium albosuccineum]|uniref:Uncharacterized protein n=1 Tax=Fusarium albosuccineum TaxID=1237068 RepID=A0A8H4P230_9HYPO|nr:hypothetical protein FALBO_16039 [Fusarium albosuccineum]
MKEPLHIAMGDAPIQLPPIPVIYTHIHNTLPQHTKHYTDEFETCFEMAGQSKEWNDEASVPFAWSSPRGGFGGWMDIKHQKSIQIP